MSTKKKAAATTASDLPTATVTDARYAKLAAQNKSQRVTIAQLKHELVSRPDAASLAAAEAAASQLEHELARRGHEVHERDEEIDKLNGIIALLEGSNTQIAQRAAQRSSEVFLLKLQVETRMEKLDIFAGVDFYALSLALKDATAIVQSAVDAMYVPGASADEPKLYVADDNEDEDAAKDRLVRLGDVARRLRLIGPTVDKVAEEHDYDLTEADAHAQTKAAGFVASGERANSAFAAGKQPSNLSIAMPSPVPSSVSERLCRMAARAEARA